MNINLSPEFTRKLAEIERQLIMDHSDGDEQKRPLLQKYHSFYVWKSLSGIFSFGFRSNASTYIYMLCNIFPICKKWNKMRKLKQVFYYFNKIWKLYYAITHDKPAGWLPLTYSSYFLLLFFNLKTMLFFILNDFFEHISIHRQTSPHVW